MELWRRNLILISGFLEALLFVGCLFGWPSLLLILEKEGVYQHVCNTTNLDETSEPVTTCAKQKVDLTFVYTTAAVLYGVIGVFVGMTLEVLGLRKTRMIGISLICAGFVFLAYTTPEHWYLIWPALNFIAVGSIILRFSGFLYAELWPKYKATIMTSYSAGYAISCSSFIVVQILYEWNFSFRLLCLCSGGICALTFIPTSMITKEVEDVCQGKRSTRPPEIETTDPDPDEKEAMSPMQPVHKEENGDENSNMISSAPAETSGNGPISMKLKLQESWKSICNWSGVLHGYWHFINFYLMLFYSSTFNLWAEEISSKDVAYYIKISGLFSFLGPFVTPCTGYAIDVMKNRAEGRSNELERIGHRMQAATYPMVASSILIGLTITCKLFNTETAIYLSMVLIALSRPAVVGCCMAYIKLRFPEDQFNMLNGIFTTFISLLCFVQYPVSKWMVQSEESYMHVHVLVVSMLFLSLISPIHMMIPKVMMKYARERRRTDSLRVINQNHVDERREREA